MSRSRDIADGSSRDAGEVVPHIIPGTLYPAVAGKLLDGSTSHSGNYGTEQSDGREYYYTDIKGSKPIKDPRIGAYFGSQRHKFKSIQLLEQESATHGKNVYTIDGREWARAVDAEADALSMGNSTNGVSLNVASDKEAWIEIVGYFNAVNLIMRVMANRKSVTPYINGVAGSTQNPSEASITTPLDGRYVDSGSLASLTLPSTSLGINTLLIKDNDDSSQYTNYYHGIELIAQDTTSTATRSQIQIPSQNVVSYGKKFTISGTPHYDPFSAKTDGSAWTSPTSGTNNANSSASWPTNIDTATSLGLDKWVDGSNYYRPYNGGRVVKWVDSSGTIKTSVTAMPPNAKSIKSADVNKKAKNAPNDTYLPTFEDETTDVNEDLLHEVAKTFHWREFGNGGANQGKNGTYADASMVDDEDDIAYVMDDGLSSLSGDNIAIGENHAFPNQTSNSYIYLTFIGTGIHLKSDHSSFSYNSTIAQNLPYGTHILKISRDDDINPDYIIDGVSINDISNTSYGNFNEVTFYQPKKPPIPEDACVIADYMLMADFVKQVTEGTINISKGVRVSNCSRDVFYDQSAGTSLINALDINIAQGWIVYKNGLSGTVKAELPYFGTDFVVQAYDASARAVPTEYINSTSLGTITYTGSGYTEFATTQNTPVLGLNGIRASGTTDAGCTRFDIATPIHTSSHYQPFETPYLHELVGGDRNMEQTNLVVSPDGRTWDSLTRNTSYLSQAKISTRIDHDATSGTYLIFDEWRGHKNANSVDYGISNFNKDFAIAYDRLICLENGHYLINTFFQSNAWDGELGISIFINDIEAIESYEDSGGQGRSPQTLSVSAFLKRGDYVRVKRHHNVEGTTTDHNHFSIIKI